MTTANHIPIKTPPLHGPASAAAAPAVATEAVAGEALVEAPEELAPPEVAEAVPLPAVLAGATEPLGPETALAVLGAAEACASRPAVIVTGTMAGPWYWPSGVVTRGTVSVVLISCPKFVSHMAAVLPSI